MKDFTYQRAHRTEDISVKNPPRFLAGGTTLLDLMKLDVEMPKTILDINALPLQKVEPTAEGGVRIGALVRNSDLARDTRIVKEYPHLAQAILAGASAQLRNMATTGGNLLQRTRCLYFRDSAQACNKRRPGSGCAAFDGYHRNLAVLGTSAECMATNPSDMNVAMMASGARVHLSLGHVKREVAINNFYLKPGMTPHLEFNLKPGELITGVTLPKPNQGSRSLYLKFRDRASYEFALASVAVIATLDNQKKFTSIRLALGGVGTIPWHAVEAEQILLGSSAGVDLFKRAAAAALKAAYPLESSWCPLSTRQRSIPVEGDPELAESNVCSRRYMPGDTADLPAY